MLKKFVLCFLILIFITGCDVSYNLDIIGNTYKEEVNFSFPINSISYDEVNAYYESKVPISLDYFNENNTFYESLLENDSNNYYLKFYYNHDLNTLKNSYFINNCYDDFSVVEKDGQIIFSTDEYFKCIYLDDGGEVDNVMINITTDYNVVSNNADKVNNNIYSWNIDKNNYSNKPINITIDKNINNSNNSKDQNISFIIIIGIISFICILLIFLFIRNRYSNVIK